MVTRRTLGAYGITTYRVSLALSNDQWAKLKAEARRTNFTGAALIERILADVCRVLPEPEPEPLPVDTADADDQEAQS